MDLFSGEEPVGELKENAVFVDCGSGIGRQVLNASVLHSFSKLIGIEGLACLDGQAQEIAAKFKEAQAEFGEG